MLKTMLKLIKTHMFKMKLYTLLNFSTAVLCGFNFSYLNDMLKNYQLLFKKGQIFLKKRGFSTIKVLKAC